MENAVLLTFLTYWQLLPGNFTMSWGLVHSLAQAPGLIPRGTTKSCAGLCSSPGNVLLHPSNPPALMVRDRSRAETQPRRKAGSPSQRWENQLVQEAFHLTMVGSGSWRNDTSNLLIPSWSLTLGIAVFTSDKILCLPPFFLLSDEQRRHLDAAGWHKAAAAHSPLTLCQLTWLSRQKGH